MGTRFQLPEPHSKHITLKLTDTRPLNILILIIYVSLIIIRSRHLKILY